MKIYKIFLKKAKNGTIEDLQVIDKGFNFLAFLFQVFYLGYEKLRIQAEIIILILILLNLSQLFFVPLYVVILFEALICIYIGFKYSSWKEKYLITNGYDFIGETFGNNKKEAKLNFLEKLNANYKAEDKLEQKIF